MPPPTSFLPACTPLRKDYADDPEDETYQALHHAFMFLSYRMNDSRRICRGRSARRRPSRAGRVDLLATSGTRLRRTGRLARSAIPCSRHKSLGPISLPK